MHEIQIQFQTQSHPIVKLFNWSWDEMKRQLTRHYDDIALLHTESSKNAEICNRHIIKCTRNKIFCSVW